MQGVPKRRLKTRCAAELVAALAVAAGTMLGLYQKGNRVGLQTVIEDYASLYVQHALDSALARPVRLRRLR